MATSKINLSTKDVCAIIKASADCGVTLLKFGDLEIEFKKQIELPSVSVTPATSPLPGTVPEITDTQHDNMTRDALVADEVSTREDNIARLVIENPQLAEELISQGELESDDNIEYSDDLDGDDE